MATTDFIAAIELGSSHIAGMAGRKNSDGSLQVLAYAHEPSASFVRRGVIYNIDKTARALAGIVSRLEAQLEASIAKVYVGIGGQPMRTERNSVQRDLEGEQIISSELIDSISDENRSCYPQGGEVEILDVVPQEYKIGNLLLADPVSVPGSNITGQFLNLVARTMLKDRLERSLQQAGVQLADDPLIAPLSLARAVLTPGEMRSGCVLVDFGADTTTVQVYKDSILRHLAVIPLGGNQVTRDIASLQMEESDAEWLKLHFGHALYEEEEDDDASAAGNAAQKVPVNPQATLPDGRTFALSLLGEVVGARVEEILYNVDYQISLSGQDVSTLFAGAVLTGGAALLPGMEEAFRRKCKMTKVRTAQTVCVPVHGCADELHAEGVVMPCTLLGLLLDGRENCCKPKPVAPPKPDVTGHTADIFQDDPAAQVVTPSSNPTKPAGDSKPSHSGQGPRGSETPSRPPKPQKSRWWQKTIDKLSNEIFSDDEMKNNSGK